MSWNLDRSLFDSANGAASVLQIWLGGSLDLSELDLVLVVSKVTHCHGLIHTSMDKVCLAENRL